MKKVQKLAVGIAAACFVLVLAYFAAAWYYSARFLLNTWINGVYCTGKTVREVNEELAGRDAQDLGVLLVDGEGKSYVVKPEEISLKRDYSEGLAKCLAAQEPVKWGVSLIRTSQFDVLPNFSYDREALRGVWENLEAVRREKEETPEVSIVLTGDGYELIDTTRHRLDGEKAFELLCGELKSLGINGAFGDAIDLREWDVYRDLEYTESQRKVLEQWEKVERFQNLEIVYDMGDEQIGLSAAELAQFLETKEDGSFKEDQAGRLCVSRNRVDRFVDALADGYDTYGKERSFQSTRGDVITLNKGSYGTLIDREAEKEHLFRTLTDEVSEVRVPVYDREAYHRGKDDIGPTYIEIDMTEQKMYFYVDGECYVETDVVTGCTGRRMGTPEGVYNVYAKQRNRTLRGPGYAAFVKYWVPVNGNIGIHDASWRGSFGGEIYKKSGSHGCINTPSGDMKKIYETVEIGTPVVIFY